MKSMEYLSKEDFNVDPVISKIFHFTDYAKAYEDATSGKYGKIVLNLKEDKQWKKLISHQLVKYLGNRGIEHIFGLCGHTNIAVLTELRRKQN